jgi:thioredoxin-like negative regulator of GroEL
VVMIASPVRSVQMGPDHVESRLELTEASPAEENVGEACEELLGIMERLTAAHREMPGRVQTLNLMVRHATRSVGGTTRLF